MLAFTASWCDSTSAKVDLLPVPDPLQLPQADKPTGTHATVELISPVPVLPTSVAPDLARGRTGRFTGTFSLPQPGFEMRDWKHVVDGMLLAGSITELAGCRLCLAVVVVAAVAFCSSQCVVVLVVVHGFRAVQRHASLNGT